MKTNTSVFNISSDCEVQQKTRSLTATYSGSACHPLENVVPLLKTKSLLRIISL
jgi:hypothetical protein